MLEINNYVAKLDIDEVLRSASASIRRYFGCEADRLLGAQRGNRCLQKVLHDFPGGSGAMAAVASADMSTIEPGIYEVNQHAADIWSSRDLTNCLRIFATR